MVLVHYRMKKRFWSIL